MVGSSDKALKCMLAVKAHWNPPQTSHTFPAYREALHGARAQLDPTMLHQSMPGHDFCYQMLSRCITPPLREKHEQRHRHNPHEFALRRGSQMGIYRVRAREITRLWRRRIEQDAA